MRFWLQVLLAAAMVGLCLWRLFAHCPTTADAADEVGHE